MAAEAGMGAEGDEWQGFGQISAAWKALELLSTEREDGMLPSILVAADLRQFSLRPC